MMATQVFNCPNCGAPLDVDGSGVTMRCPYCDTSVVVPAELRPKLPADLPQPIQETAFTLTPSQVAAAAQQRRSRYLLWGILGAALLFVLALIIIPSLLNTRSTKMGAESVDEAIQRNSPPLATSIIGPTEVSALPTPTSTPDFAHLVNTFGFSGIGPGLLNQAEYIAIEGTGTLYVADYRDGRIQAFDPEGNYLHGWQVGYGETSIYGMAVAYDGTLYVASGGDIYRYEGSSGKGLGKLDYEKGKEFGDLAALPDGGVLGVWYEGRWRLITSLEGHRDDLVWFDAEGNVVRVLESFISGQTDDAALDTKVAVDGLGTIYALSRFDSTVFKFTSQGKYVDRFGETGSDPGQHPSTPQDAEKMAKFCLPIGKGGAGGGRWL